MKTRAATLVQILVIILIGLLLSWPVILHGLPDLSNDGGDHARWAKQFSEQFWHGDLSPRWLMNANAGLGSPGYFFYPHVASYAAALFWPMAHSTDPHGWRISGYACVLGLVLSGITSFFWLRSLTADRYALLGAVLYIAAPYHLAINLYNRAAAAEFWIFVWIPLVMLSAHRVVQGNRWAFVSLCVSYALAVLTHPTVAMCFAAVPFAYVLLFAAPGQRIRAGIVTGLALALGIALAGFFLLPALLDQHKATVARQTVNSSDYHYWWLFSVNDEIARSGAAAAGVPVYLNFKVRILVITLSTVFYTLLLFATARSKEVTRRLAWFFLGVSLVSLFFMLEISEIFWRTLPFMKFVQSPSRLNVMHAVSATAMTALALPYVVGHRLRIVLVSLAAIWCGWLAADIWAASRAFSAWRAVPADKAALQRRGIEAQREYPAFWPIDAPVQQIWAFPAFDTFLAEHPPRAVTLNSSDGNPGSVSLRSWAPRRILFAVDAPAPATLTLNHFYYEGWAAHVEGRNQSVPVIASKPGGLMRMQVPPGTYTLTVELPLQSTERTGLLISLGAVVALAVVSLIRIPRSVRRSMIADHA